MYTNTTNALNTLKKEKLILIEENTNMKAKIKNGKQKQNKENLITNIRNDQPREKNKRNKEGRQSQIGGGN